MSGLLDSPRARCASRTRSFRPLCCIRTCDRSCRWHLNRWPIPMVTINRVASLPPPKGYFLKSVTHTRSGPSSSPPMAYTPVSLCRRLENQGYHIEHNFGHGELPSRSQKPDWHKSYWSGVASRSGTPIEIVSKVIMRHAHLSTTQRYLGKVTDVEAMRWIENLYG